MWSTRARLAAAFAGLLFGTLVAYSAAVYFARRNAAYQELGVEAVSAANRVLRRVVQANAERPVTSRDSLYVVEGTGWPGSPPHDASDCAPPNACRWRYIVRPLPAMQTALGPLPDYFLMLDGENAVLYASDAMRQLPSAALAEVSRVGQLLNPGGNAALVTVPVDTTGRGRMLLVARNHAALQPNISRVVVAVPTTLADVPAGLLLGTMLLLAPLVLLISVAVAYLLAGNAFKPVDQIINEVEAITDGRSLHRRLPTDEADEELGRLAETLNRMIGRLQTSFGALRRFTADASHELKTPLTVVRADVERAMHPKASPHERMEALEEAMQEIARMSDLVDSLLTLARADEGRFDLHREPIHLEPVVRDVYETAMILGEEAGVTVSLPLVEDAVVLGDATRLRQLFLNLITNAIKYTSRGGHVEITLSLRNNNEVGFKVSDTGVGIAAADLPHVFDRFWRADRARSRRGGGSERGGFGLGLAISQWIAKAHGGSLTAQSRLGRGSTFTTFFPIADADSQGPAPVED